MKFKNLLLSLAAVSAAFTLSAEGIDFVPAGTTFADAVAKAKAENKMVFVDCYTSWCGPCKMLSTKIFPLDEVGAYMNPRFVSIKIDMEQGEGPALKDRFEVAAFPTMIMFNSDGNELNRMVGATRDGARFIHNVDSVIAASANTLTARFDKGERSREFLLEYLDELNGQYRKARATQVAEILLNGQAESFVGDTVLVKVFMDNISDPYNEMFRSAVLHPETLNAAIGETKLKGKINGDLQTYAYRFIPRNLPADLAGLDKYIAYLKNDLSVADADKYRYSTLIAYHKRQSDWASLIATMKEFESNPAFNGLSDNALVTHGYAITRNCQDKTVRAALNDMLKQRIADIKSGKRIAAELKGYPAEQQPLAMMESLSGELTFTATNGTPATTSDSPATTNDTPATTPGNTNSAKMLPLMPQ